MDKNTEQQDKTGDSAVESTGVKRSAVPSTDEPAYKKAMNAALPPRRTAPPLMPSDFAAPDPKRAATKSTRAATASVPKATLAPPGTMIYPYRRKNDPALSQQGATTASPSLQPRTGSSSGSKKVASSDKGSKGLRHFSMEVCKKVEEKGTTTYNQVADELVAKMRAEKKREEFNSKFDEKNIRRRVYDALNVLMAMDIIVKEKKQITWQGLPTSAHHDLQLLEREEQYRKEQVQNKRRALQEILVQQICFRNLVSHNKGREVETLNAEKVPLPFIVVNTHKDAVINCNMAPDLSNVLLEFDRSFEINDDNSILTRLGM